jgi:hypothetical protein
MRQIFSRFAICSPQNHRRELAQAGPDLFPASELPCRIPACAALGDRMPWTRTARDETEMAELDADTCHNFWCLNRFDFSIANTALQTPTHFGKRKLHLKRNCQSGPDRTLASPRSRKYPIGINSKGDTNGNADPSEPIEKRPVDHLRPDKLSVRKRCLEKIRQCSLALFPACFNRNRKISSSPKNRSLS